MANLAVISRELGLRDNQLELVNGNVFVVVHEKWLAHILSKQTLPQAADILWPDWHGENHAAFGDLSKPWLRLQIQAINSTPDTCLRVPILDQNGFHPEQNFFQFLGAIASRNYKQQWKEAYREGNTLQSQLASGSSSKLATIMSLVGRALDFTSIDVSLDLIKSKGFSYIDVNFGEPEHRTELSDSASALQRLGCKDAISIKVVHDLAGVCSRHLPKILYQDIPLKDILTKLYGCPFIETSGSEVSDNPPSQSCHGSLVPVLCCITSPSAVYLLQSVPNYTVQQCKTFSPAMLANSYAKPLYIVYQLLQIVDTFHGQGLTCGNINLCDFTLQENLWVHFIGPQWEQLITNKTILPTIAVEEKSESSQKIILNSYTELLKEVQLVDLEEVSVKSLPEITRSWVLGGISNFEYLMILNYLAGRRVNDPNYHPVVPWVCDFSTKDSGLRDLSKSKYRLTKGDQHLGMMYEAAHRSAPDRDAGLTLTRHVPHHITGMLADITYYVYKSRQMPQSVLCGHVRRKWVPEEYPGSMQRMQEWTPDECIPEFFCDPQIFRSIHEDLSDLEVPPWCEDGESFIRWHRSVLESDAVSDKLHRWIDITFGYKLSGGPAKKSMNVFLHLMDDHTNPTGHGIVQLFHAPHPKKRSPSPYMGIDAPMVTRNNLKAPVEGTARSGYALEGPENPDFTATDSTSTLVVSTPPDQSSANQSEAAEATPALEISTDSMDVSTEKADATIRPSAGFDGAINTTMQPLAAEDNPGIKNPIKKLPFFRVKTDSADKTELRPEDALIKLPEDYDPLAALNQVEALYSFSSKSLHGIPKPVEQEDLEEDFDRLVEKDMLALGCTIAELFMSSKIRSQHPRLPLEERKRITLRTLQTDWPEIPRPCRDIVQSLLKINVTSLTLCQPVQPFTTSFLLSPYSGVIPFPQFMSPLFQLARELSENEASISRHQYLSSMDQSGTSTIESLKRFKIHIARRVMPEVLALTNEEGKDILLLYLLELFRNPETGLFALLMLLNKLAQYLGPKKTAEHCLPIIKATYEMRHTSSHFILLYHRPFLMQLMVRLGCRVFLRHIVGHVVTAINGLKDCPLHISEDESWVQSSFHRNSGVDFVGISDVGNKDMEFEGAVFDITGLGEKRDVSEDEQSMDEEGSVSDEENSRSSSAVIVSSTLNDENKDRSSEDTTSLDVDGFSLDDERTSLDGDQGSSDVGGTSTDTKSLDNKSVDETSQDDRTSEATLLDKVDSSPDHDETRALDGVSRCLDDRNGSVDVETHPLEAENSGLEVDSELREEENHFVDEDTPTFVRGNIDRTKGGSLEAGDGSPSSLRGIIRPDARSSTPEPPVGSSTPEPVPSGPFFHPVSADLPVNISLSEVCSQSTLWMAERLGPALTSHYIVTNLLEALLQCYTGAHLLDHPLNDCHDNQNDFSLVGDINAEPVLKCLVNIYELYGEEIVLQQYLPFIQDSVPAKKSKVLMKHESRIIAALVLLVRVLEFVSEKVLDENRRLITKKIIYPIINLMSSLNHVFPSGGGARNSLCRKLVAAITTLAFRLGRDRGRTSLQELLHDFFLRFDIISGVTSVAAIDRKLSNLSTDSDDYYCEIKRDSLTDQYRVGTPTRIDDLKGEFNDLKSPPMHSPILSGITEGSDSGEYKQEALLQLESVFTPEMAYIAYVPLCRLIGSIHMENTISNHELIWKLYNTHETFLSSKPHQGNKEKTKELEIPSTVVSGRASSPDVSSRGGTSLPASLGEDSDKQYGVSSVTNRHLKGAWQHYWEQFIGNREDNDSYHLSQMKLQTFSGHSAGIRALQVMPNENSFASASRDKTVKLWSLRNYGDGSANVSCQFTYPHHKKTVFALNYLESQRLIASCDGNVYVWDPFGSGAALRGYDLSKNVPTCMIAMPAPNPVLIVSTPDATVQIIDIRQPVVQHELRVSAGPLGLIRCLSVSPDGTTLGVGLSSGVLSLVDLRTGLLLGGWRAHEGEILQVKAHNNRSFVTSSVDSTMSLWREDGTKMCSFRGITEPVSFLCLSNSQIITASTSCRMGIYTSISEQASFSSTKVRSDVFKGVVSALDVLPLNKLFLVGSENGQITLMA